MYSVRNSFQIIVDALTVFYYVVVCLRGYHLIPTVIQWHRLNVVVNFKVWAIIIIVQSVLHWWLRTESNLIR